MTVREFFEMYPLLMDINVELLETINPESFDYNDYIFTNGDRIVNKFRRMCITYGYFCTQSKEYHPQFITFTHEDINTVKVTHTVSQYSEYLDLTSNESVLALVEYYTYWDEPFREYNEVSLNDERKMLDFLDSMIIKTTT